jgi:sensor c-di-GMP phosphodiesterase-like protein
MVLGTGAADLIGHTIQLREGRAELRTYAERLVQFGEQLGGEDSQAIQAISHDGLPFCSDREISLMRDYVFRSRHIRDLGRTKDGKFYCSADVGALTSPRPMPIPDITTDEVKLYLRIPLMISTRTTGFVAELNGVTVVLNPEAIENLEEPPRFYSGMLFDRQHNQMTQTHGPAIPLSMDEIVAGRMIERKGVVYQPLCSATSMVCQVAFESRSDMLARKGMLFAGFLAGGALLGGALAWISILFHRAQRSIERQLRRAIQMGKLTMVYQPVVELETRTIVGAEALVRWVNEDGEVVRPEVFVALAEEKRFVGEITRLVVRRVAEELGSLLAGNNFRVTINITSQDLANPEFFAQLEECIVKAKLNPSAIGLELTERSTADQNMAIRAITQLNKAGHAVYIDDFGTGYSSLAYLHRLGASAIKIDRAFTQTVGTEAVTASVVPLILEMAAQLNLLVVVEGIETTEQAEYFRQAGAGILGQGWLFGRPVPAAELRARAAAGRERPQEHPLKA